MADACQIYVRFVEGTTGMAPVAAVRTSDGTFRLLENNDFDPEDCSTLFEYLPGDEVRATSETVDAHGRPESILVARELVQSSARDREYWHILFSVAFGSKVHLSLQRTGCVRLLIVSAQKSSAAAGGTIQVWSNGHGGQVAPRHADLSGRGPCGP